MKRLNLRFAVIMTIYGGAVFLVYRDEVLGPVLAPLAVTTARLTANVLHTIGIEALREAAVLSHPGGFAYEIAYTCSGFLPVATLVVCILAGSGSLTRKLVGIAVGVPTLLAVNVLRLVHLFYIGIYSPGTFAFAHEVLWEGLLAAAFIGLWLTSLRYSNRHPCVAGSARVGASPRQPNAMASDT